MEEKKDKQKERMLEIMHSLENPKENIKEHVNEFDEKQLIKEQRRLEDLASGDLNQDFRNESYFVSGRVQTGGRGQTVNSIAADYDNAAVNPKSKSQPSNFKPEEVLEVCIKRSLKSGAPINNIGFYDEVNWNLMSLGFPARNEIDIKAAIVALIKE